MRAFDKLVKDCNEADIAAENQERERARLAQKVSAYRGELNAAQAAFQGHMNAAQKITQEAAEKSLHEIEQAEAIEKGMASIRKRLAAAEQELSAVTVPTKRVSTAAVPNILRWN